MTSYLGNLFGKLNPLAIVIIAAILGILVTSIVVTLILRKRYMTLQWDLEDKENREQVLFNSSVLNSIIDDYKIAAKGKGEDINTQAIIEKNFNNELKGLYLGEKFVSKAVSLMIILGLLGTFYGLTLSIGKLVELLSSGGNTDVLESMDSVVMGLINSVKGMSVAFVTSLFGISSSIVLTIINIFIGVEDVRESVMVAIEEYLDNTLAQQVEKDEEITTEEQLTNSIQEFTGKLETSIKEITDILSYRFAAATSGIEEFSTSLLKSVEKFDNSLQTFSENTRDFAEFNHHLKNNIQRMSLSFDDFTQDLKENTKDLSKSMENLADKIDKR